jgi:glutamine amidotransferase
LLQLLDPEVFLGITGNTDSEHIFALFLSLLPLGREDLYSVEVVALTIEKTIATIVELCTTYVSIRVAHACSMNLCVSDGISIVATR